MRPALHHKVAGITLIEVVLVIVVVLFLLSMLLPATHRACCKSSRISCVNNLKQIGVAYRIWSNDNGARFPAMQSVANGGWSDLLTNANQGPLCWTNYAIMANEMGQSPRIIICPAEARWAADNFTNLANKNVSYLVGVTTDDSTPQSLLGCDRNLAPGTKPGDDSGFSPENGQGNDVAIQTNSKAGPICWSLKIHSIGNAGGGGNILLGDGSSQQVNSASLRQIWQPNFYPTTNWPAGHVPSSPSIRVLFP
jgi:hypothetical protein